MSTSSSSSDQPLTTGSPDQNLGNTLTNAMNGGKKLNHQGDLGEAFSGHDDMMGTINGINSLVDYGGAKIDAFGQSIIKGEGQLFLTGDTTASFFAFSHVTLFAMFTILAMSIHGMNHIMDPEFKQSIRTPIFVHVMNILFILVVIVYTSGHESVSPLEAAIMTTVIYIWFLMVTKLSGPFIYALLVVVLIAFFVTHNEQYTTFQEKQILEATKEGKAKDAINARLQYHLYWHNMIIVVLMFAMVALSFVGFGQHLTSNKLISRKNSVWTNIKSSVKALFYFDSSKTA